jgi:hypothetical protein
VIGGYDRRVRSWVGEKQKCSPNYDFYGRSTFWSSCNLTGGSDVRGKAGPIWVRKVFIDSFACFARLASPFFLSTALPFSFNLCKLLYQ